MKNPLKILQTISKIAGIVCKVIMIACIVGACMCLVGIVGYALGADLALKLGGINIHNIVENEAGITPIQMYISIAISAFILAVEAIIAGLSSSYFKNEQKAGTPFTKSGADELFRLGVITTAISVGSGIITSIIFSIAKLSDIANANSDSATVGLGIFYIVMSIVCSYGAEIAENANTTEISVPEIAEKSSEEANTVE